MPENAKNQSPYSISQNFLTSKKTIERILGKADIGKRDTVLEIGAGKGHITKALSLRCKEVVSYEIDRKLYDTLKPRLPENVRLYRADFLKAPLPKTPYKVFANIPFSITTAIVRKLTQNDNPPDAVWLVMEKGAAKRFCGLPRDTLSSLLIKPFYEAKIVYHFRREDFHPAPKTDAVLLEFRQKQTPDIPLSLVKEYRTFLSHSIQHGLYGPRALLTKKQIGTALRLEKLPPIDRSGDILYIQWLCLFRCSRR